MRRPDAVPDDPPPRTPADHFSDVAAGYAAWRPTYPPALFAWLAGLAPSRDAAWEAGAGSGQATVGLAPHFARVVATDASAAQVARAPALANVAWRTAPAEASGLPDASVALVAAAQAVHWFDRARFWEEARRVLVPGGVVAVWTYALFATGDAAVDALVARFAGETVGPWWPPERRIVDEGLRTIAFPFAEVAPPPFAMRAAWDLPHLLGYLGTWSAVALCHEATGADPVAALAPALGEAWGEPSRVRQVEWPLSIRAGRVA